LLSVFEIELRYVKDEHFRGYLRGLLNKFESVIKAAPASVHGHHPEDERGPGGLIKHCKRVAWFCMHMVREHKLDDVFSDAMIGAAIFHDIGRVIPYKRDGEDVADYHKKRHGPASMRFILEQPWPKTASATTRTREMLELIKTHMSHWDPDAPQPSNSIEMLFATADYFAARSNLNVPFLELGGLPE